MTAKTQKGVSFLVKLGIGWIIGFGLSVLILASLFEAHIYQISSVFFGLTLFAIPMVIKEEAAVIKGQAGNLVFTLLGAALVFAISWFNPSGGEGIRVSADQLSFGLGIYIFFAAMIAITAMVLPGISGSTLLLIFGLYVPVIGAIKELLHFNFSYLPVVVIFGLGVVTGIIAIIKFVKICLERHRSPDDLRHSGPDDRLPICHSYGAHYAGCAKSSCKPFYLQYPVLYFGRADSGWSGAFKGKA